MEKKLVTENWIEKQMRASAQKFETTMSTQYPESAAYTSDPQLYFNRVCIKCNYLDATKILDWNMLIPDQAKIFDMAAGTGWLTAYLSSIGKVGSVTALDASKTYLERNLPVSVAMLNGNIEKITTIEGLFSPLFFEAQTFDLVVVSSSLHHSENLTETLKEIHRVLKPSGKCIILNETPAKNFRYLKTISFQFLKIFFRMITRRYLSISPSISSSGFLYDPLLGDRLYPEWYWLKSIDESGLKLKQRVDSQMSTVKGLRGPHLIHFICEA